MQELITQLQNLQEKDKLTQDEILKLTSEEDLLFFFREGLGSSEPQYNSIYDLFNQMRQNLFEQGEMNIFNEYLTVKLVCLREIYGVDQILVDAAIALFGPVYLDYKLEGILGNDDFYNFIIKRYKEYKADNEVSVLKMLNSLDFTSFSADLAEMQGVFEEFKKYIPEDAQ